MNNFELKDLDEQNQSKIADIKNLRTEKIKMLLKSLVPVLQYEFALADRTATANCSIQKLLLQDKFDEATKLATDAPKSNAQSK